MQLISFDALDFWNISYQLITGERIVSIHTFHKYLSWSLINYDGFLIITTRKLRLLPIIITLTYQN